MSKEISFLHAADLHLDSPFKGLAHMPASIFEQVRESTFAALDRLINMAIETQVDFLLIVGDLFDNEKQSLKAQIRLRTAFEELERHHINVYLSYGNHDYTKGNRHPVTYPDNVFIFPDEKVRHFIHSKDGQKIAEIHGFSYENRAVLTNKTAEYQVVDKTIPYHIAMLHGSVQGNTEHDTYAPFQLSELMTSSYDYWALGHIHKQEILKEDPSIVYPGNIQGRHRNETGEKGCVHVVLSENQQTVDFIPLQSIVFTRLMLDVSACEEIHQLERMIQHKLTTDSSASPQLIDLILVSKQEQLNQWENDGDLQEIIDLINETTIQSSQWSYIFRHSLQVEVESSKQRLEQGDHFISELARQVEEGTIYDMTEELFKHRQARKYVDMISEQEGMAIKSEARDLLMNELLHSRKRR